MSNTPKNIDDSHTGDKIDPCNWRSQERADTAPKASGCFLEGSEKSWAGFGRFIGRNRKSRRREAAGGRNYAEAVPNGKG